MKKSIFCFVAVLLLGMLFVGSAAAMGGSGTQADPWTINSLDDLKLLSGIGYASYVGSDKYFLLTTDIIDDGTFTSIGTAAYSFNGNFNGGNHTIYCLQTSVFAANAFNGVFKNTNFSMSCINITGNYNGAIIVPNVSNKQVSFFVDNCNFDNIFIHVSGSGNHRVGLVCGSVVNISSITVSNCNVTNTTLFVEGTPGWQNMSVGGILGSCQETNMFIDNCVIRDSSFIGHASAASSTSLHYVGGILGNHPASSSYPGRVDNCHVNNVNLYNLLLPTNVYPYFYGDLSIVTDSDYTNISYDEDIFLRVTSGASLTNDSPRSDPKQIGEIVTFTVNGQQGAAVYLQNNQIKSGYEFSYGEGGSMVGNNPLTASYSSNGEKSATLTLKGWNGSSVVSGGTLTSTVYIGSPPIEITSFTTTPPTTSYVAVNTPVTITATVDNPDGVTYSWYYTTDPNPSASSVWTKIGDDTDVGTTTYNLETGADYTFKVIASKGTESTDSFDTGLTSLIHAVGTPTLSREATIGTTGYVTDTSYDTVHGPLDQTAYLSVAAAAAGGTLMYQWFDNGMVIHGGVTADYPAVNADTVSTTHAYYCRISSVELPEIYVETRTVYLNTYKEPTITVTPTAGNIGDTITLSADGAGYTVQWRESKDEGPYTDIGTTNPYSYAPTTAGTYHYQGVFTYPGGYTQTVTATDMVTIYAAPTITVSPTVGTAGETPVTLTATNTGFDNVQWKVSMDGVTFTDIGEGNPFSYTPIDVGVHYYQGEFIYSGGLIQTVTATDTVTLYPMPALTISPTVGSVGTVVTLSAVDTGFTTIQWKVSTDGVNWTNLGTTNPYSYAPTTGGVYQYQAVVTYSGGFTQTASSPDRVTIYNIPNITMNPTIGDPETVVTFTAENTGFTNVEWWQAKEGAEYLPIGTGNPLNFAPTAPNTYHYQAVLTYPGGYTYTVSPTQTVKIFGKPDITVSPTEGTIGDAVTLTAEDTGFTSIQWKVSTDGATFTNLGTTNPYSYTPPSTGTYYYQAVFTYPGGHTQTVTARDTASIYAEPVPTVTPTAGTVGDTVTLSANDTGYSSIQWKVSTDGTTFTNLGTTNPYSYAPAAAGTYYYQGVFTYPRGYVQTITLPQTVTIYTEPVLTVTPTIGFLDTPVTLTATDTGYSSLQWKVSTDGTTFTNLGTTNPYTYTPGAEGTYHYQAVFTYPGGYTHAVTSDTTVSIYDTPTATVSPTVGGLTDTFTLTTQNLGSDYQWYYSADDGTTWNQITGATTAVYSLVPQTAGLTAGQYIFRAAYTYHSMSVVSTNTQTVTIYAEPVLTVTPTVGTLGDTVTLSATSTGYSSLQWKVSTDGTTFTNLGTTNPYSYAPTSTGTYYYQGVFTYPGGYSQTITAADTVTIYAAPTLTVSPTVGNIGDTITLTATNTGYSSLQWKVSTDGTTWTNLGTTNPYSYAPAAAGTYHYQGVFTYSGGLTQTVTATDTATIYAEPTITVTPTVGGTSTEVTISATDTGYTGVQWKVSKDGGSYTNLSTANPYSYTPGNAGTYTYQGVFTYAGGHTQTITAAQIVTIYAEPTLAVSPTAGDVGTTVTLNATNTGFTGIQWKVSTDGVTYTDLGATNPYSYTPDAGTYHYQAVLTYPGGYTQTVTALQTATIYPVPVLTVTPTVGDIGDTVTLTATDTGFTGIQWKVSTDGTTWTNLGTTNPYSYAPISAGTYHYQAVLTYTGGHTQTVTATDTVTIYAKPELTLSPLAGELGDTVTLTATNTGFNGIQWKVSTDGTTWTNLGTINPYSYAPAAPGTYHYQAVFTYAGGHTQTVTATDTVIIYPAATVTVTPLYGGTTDTVTMTAIAEGYTDIQWKVSKDGGAYTNLGTTNPYSYVPGVAGTYSYQAVITYTGGHTQTVTATNTVTIYAAPTLTVTPTVGGLATAVTISATDTGFTSIQWKVSKDGGAYTNLGTTNPYSYTPGEAGTYTYQGVFTYSGGYTQTITATDTVTIYAEPSLTINPTIGGVGDQVTLTATNTGYTSMQWEVSTDGITYNQLGATNPYSYFPAAGTYHYRAVFTYPAGYTQTVTAAQTVTIYAAPELTVTPVAGGLTTPVTLTATDTGYSSLQWKVSKDGGGYTNLGTANPYTYTPGSVGTYSYQGVFTYPGGYVQTVYVQASVVIYADPIPVTPGGPTAPIAVPYQITLTAAVQNPETVTAYYWQLQTGGGTWTRTADGPNYQPTIINPGLYVYRFVAVGYGGQEIPSPTLTVDAGYAPTADITAPSPTQQYNIGDTVGIQATIGGTDGTYTFDFGDHVESYVGKTGTVDELTKAITASVVYLAVREYKTIKLTVSNRYGPAATDTVQIMYGQPRRPIATQTPIPLDTSGMQELIEKAMPQSAENQMPDITGMIKGVTKPFTDVIGEWFWLLLFAVPFLIMWIRQKNLLIPSIIGVLFAAWLLVFLPGAAMKAAIGILILAVAGGIYGLYVRTHRQ